MVTALVLSTSGVATSAVSGGDTATPSCVVQDETALEAGIRDQRDRLTAQHAQEAGLPQRDAQEVRMVTYPEEDNRC
jgi:hypothetical protein